MIPNTDNPHNTTFSSTHPMPQPMLSALTHLRTTRHPKVPIAGLLLTSASAHFFLATLLSILPLLTAQLHSIAHLHLHDPSFTSHLRAIQQRQHTFQAKLSELVTATRASSEPWVAEISDAHLAIVQKIRQCNAQSASSLLGWKFAAARYWPLIAESYTTLQPNLVRLFNEVDEALANKELWEVPKCQRLARRLSLGWFGSSTSTSTTAAKVQGGVRTSFDEDVQARWIEGDEEPEGVRGERGFTVPLSSDGKRTVQKFRTGKTKAKSVAAVRPRALGEEEEMEEGDGQRARAQPQEIPFRFEFPPMPL
jgi:hypothetical protein